MERRFARAAAGAEVPPRAENLIAGLLAVLLILLLIRVSIRTVVLIRPERLTTTKVRWLTEPRASLPLLPRRFLQTRLILTVILILPLTTLVRSDLRRGLTMIHFGPSVFLQLQYLNKEGNSCI